MTRALMCAAPSWALGLSNYWRYKIDFVLNPGANDASGNPATGGEDVAVDDAYLEYAGDTFSFVIGEHNVASPLEDHLFARHPVQRALQHNAFGFGRAAVATRHQWQQVDVLGRAAGQQPEQPGQWLRQ